MLNTRYVHLHEALGLGAMWLKHGAKVIDSPSQNLANQYIAPKTKSPSEPPAARLAVLQKLNSDRLPKTRQPEKTSIQIPQTQTENQTIDSVEIHLQNLANKVPKAQIMALSVCASPADVIAGELLSGEAGKLFQKMMLAIDLKQEDVYLNTWLKDLPDFNPKPSSEWVLAARHRVWAEWQLSQAKALLLMGEFFERDDVKTQLPPHAQAFYIPHPQRILSNPTLKRGAWETLQALQKYLAA